MGKGENLPPWKEICADLLAVKSCPDIAVFPVLKIINETEITDGHDQIIQTLKILSDSECTMERKEKIGKTIAIVAGKKVAAEESAKQRPETDFGKLFTAVNHLKVLLDNINPGQMDWDEAFATARQKLQEITK